MMMQRPKNPNPERCHVMVQEHGRMVSFRQCGRKADGTYMLDLPLSGHGGLYVEAVPVCRQHYRQPERDAERRRKFNAELEGRRRAHDAAAERVAVLRELGVECRGAANMLNGKPTGGVTLSADATDALIARLKETT